MKRGIALLLLSIISISWAVYTVHDVGYIETFFYGGVSLCAFFFGLENMAREK